MAEEKPHVLVRLTRRRREPSISQGEIAREQYDRLVADKMNEAVHEQHVQRAFLDAGFDLLYHTLRSKGSDKGFPDDVAIHRSRRRLVVVENKRQTGKNWLSPHQVAWLDGWAGLRDYGNPGIEVYAPVRPLDRDRLIETLFRGSTEENGGLHVWHAGSCDRCDAERRGATERRTVTW